MRIERLRGPIDDSWLRAIADLYGPHNAKYRDVRFCDRLFNRNPTGYSLHAFAMAEDGTPVGHYAVVPMAAVAPGRRFLSAKGEAFVVHERARGATVGGEGGFPVGLALPKALYAFAEREGLDPVHMIAPAEVSVIHRLCGSRPIDIRHERAKLILRPGRVPFAGGRPWQRLRQRWLASGQATLSSWIRTLAIPRRGRFRSCALREADAELVRRLAARIPEPSGWSPLLDEGVLRWMAELADLRLVANGGALEDVAVVTPHAGAGEVMEVVFWRLGAPTAERAQSLLRAVIEEARAAGSSALAFSSSASWEAEEMHLFRRASRPFLFHARTESAGFLARSRDPYFLDPRTIHFSPFFYAAF